MEPSVAHGVMMLHLANKIWDTLKTTYGHDKNISKVFEVYMQLFMFTTTYEKFLFPIYNTVKMSSMLYEFRIHYGGFFVDDGSGKIYKNGVVA